MTAITLQGVWLNDAANPSDYITPLVTVLDDGWDTGISVRTYAGGRQRAVTTLGLTQVTKLAIDLADAATVAWLKAKLAASAVLCLRDPYGKREFGVLAGAANATSMSRSSTTSETFVPYSFGGIYKVGLYFLATSFDETAAP